MKRIQKGITIDAPVEKVFNFITNPANLPEIWPSLIEVRDLEPASQGGMNFSWVCKMIGVRFEGRCEKVAFIRNQRIVDQTKGGVESIFTWEFHPMRGGTFIDLTVDYGVPVPLLGRLSESIIAKTNEREAEAVLANLKAKLEAAVEPAA